MSGSSVVQYAANSLVHGSGDAAAAVVAAGKAILLGNILQGLTQVRVHRLGNRIKPWSVELAIACAIQNEELRASIQGSKAAVKATMSVGFTAGGAAFFGVGALVGYAGASVGSFLIDGGEMVAVAVKSGFANLSNDASPLEQAAHCLVMVAFGYPEGSVRGDAAKRAIEVIAPACAINHFSGCNGHLKLYEYMR
jgi:hypothetical protein